MPTLQRMEDNPHFLERGRRRFDYPDPPSPNSRCASTEAPSPDFFVRSGTEVDGLINRPLDAEERYRLWERCGNDLPYTRYDYESRQEERRILDHMGCRDQEGNLLYRGPDLMGRAGSQRLCVVVRHCKKKQWEKLRVWNSAWGVPRRVGGSLNDDLYEWKWEWDEERERAGCKNRKFDQQPYEMKKLAWPAVDEESPDESALRLHRMRRRGATDLAHEL